MFDKKLFWSGEPVSVDCAATGYGWDELEDVWRKGLMLVNMSMVDPGYEGHLACLFVNFGREPVDIDPGMTVARLIFHRLDSDTPKYGKGDEVASYDRNLREVALSGPSSFLSIREFSATFQEEKKRVLADFDREAKASAGAIQKQLEKEIGETFRTTTSNLPWSLLKSSGIALGAIAIITAAMSFTPWLKDHLGLDRSKEIAAAVEEEVGRRLQPMSTLDGSRGQALEQRVQELEATIRALRQPTRQDTQH